LKVLVVEYGSHTVLLRDLKSLFEQFAAVDFILPSAFRSHDFSLNSGASSNVFFASNIFFFLNLFFKCFRYDFIYVSTGPEEISYKNNIQKFLFFLICAFFKRKIAINVRSVSRYTSSFFLSNSIKYCLFCAVETESIRNYFTDFFIDTCCIVVPSRFRDLSIPSVAELPFDKIRIGLLGSINYERRDYSFLKNVSSNDAALISENVTFVVVGACSSSNLQKFQADFSGYDIEVSTGELSESDFKKLGSSCHVFLAPQLSVVTGESLASYGVNKGSGAYGDCVYFNRKLIVPKFMYSEDFNDYLICYDDFKSLVNYIYSISTHVPFIFEVSSFNQKDFMFTYKSNEIKSLIESNIND
jgi:hypothetical protein